MYGFLFRPKWIGFHLLVVAGIVLMVNFGFWQLRRLDQRQEFNAVVEQRYDAPAVPLDDLLDPTLSADQLAETVTWRPVTALGVYATDQDVLIVNRSQNGRAGENVVTPLILDDGRILLVNRGFVPIDVDVPAAPANQVAVLGRLRPSEQRHRGQLTDAAEGPLELAQRLDLDRLSPQFEVDGGEVVDMYIDLIESNPAEPSRFPEQVLEPDLSEGNHLSYAVQWFAFSIAVAVGWVLAVRRSIATRRKERDEDRSADDADGDTRDAPKPDMAAGSPG